MIGTNKVKSIGWIICVLMCNSMLPAQDDIMYSISTDGDEMALLHDPDIFSELYLDLMEPVRRKKSVYNKLEPTLKLINLGDGILEDSLVQVIHNAAKAFYGLPFRNEVMKRSRELNFEEKVFDVLNEIKTSRSVQSTLYFLDKYNNNLNTSDQIFGSTASNYLYQIIRRKCPRYNHSAIGFTLSSLLNDDERDQFIKDVKDQINTDPAIWNSDIRNNINYEDK